MFCFLELISLEEYLTYTIPFIKYSVYGTTNKATTKASGDPPNEVKLWDGFFNYVNSQILVQTSFRIMKQMFSELFILMFV